MSSHVQMFAWPFTIVFLAALVLQNISAFTPPNVCSDLEGDLWNYVPCDEYYKPDSCINKTLVTLDDFDLCGPAYMPLQGRNYFLAASGRRETYKDNKRAIRKIKIIPKVLRDITKSSTKVTILGTELDYPIGVAPLGFHKLANLDGEIAMATGLSTWKTIMVLSHYATTPLEDVAERAKGTNLTLWMQVYLMPNRNMSVDIVHRAERSGYKAIVLTVDTNVSPRESCHARAAAAHLPPGVKFGNVPDDYIVTTSTFLAMNATFQDIAFLKTKTKLPIIAKGIISGADAIKAIKAGASAIVVSNHGGRQMDYCPATIDALTHVVDTVKEKYPHVEIYMDGGIRDGFDTYKALARGAKMVFIGRPSVWGIAYNGSDGINQVMDFITKDFKEAMTLAGRTDPSEITRDSLIPQMQAWY